jgi:hypothetical protein
MQEYADAIHRGFNEMPVSETTELWCEPGRALVAEASSVLCRVDLRKGDALYLNDGSYGSLFDATHSRWPFPTKLVRDGEASGELKAFQFYGPTCDSIDHMPGPFWLPADIREKVTTYRHLSREDFIGWHKILAAKGWSVPHWPKEWGGTGWNITQRYIFEEEFGVAGAPETFLVDQSGTIRYKHVGVIDNRVWDEVFVPLLAELR